MATVGIPRCLTYYTHGTLWEEYLRNLGHQVVVTGPTTKALLTAGVSAATDQTCLPIKTSFGHISSLRHKVDFIMFPRLVSLERGCYICPKFMGLPDMVRAAFPDMPPLLSPDVEGYKGGDALGHALLKVGHQLGHSRHEARLAYEQAATESERSPAWARLLDQLQITPHVEATTARPSIAVLGHPYNVYDAFINMNLLQRLKAMGYAPVTYEMLGEPCIEEGLSGIRRHIFWTFGRRIVGAARFLTDYRAVSGIIHLASFGCGPDSFTGQMTLDYCDIHSMPYLELTLDEHTGEAGFQTRLEAFSDMLQRRVITA